MNLNHQKERFFTIFPNGTAFKPAIIEQITSNKAYKGGITSALWKFFLVLFPEVKKNTIVSKEWVDILIKKREIYNEYKEKRKINTIANDSQDPLNRDDPMWVQYFSDLELMESIKRDTSRFFASFTAFKISNSYIEATNNALFFYMRYFNVEFYYQEMQYLACEFLINCIKEMHCSNRSDCYEILFDEKSIESDMFWILSGAMNVLYPFFDVNNFDKGLYKTKDYCLELESKIINKYDNAPEFLLVKENGVECLYMSNMVKRLFNSVFPDDWDHVLTLIFAFFPSMDFVACLVEAVILKCIHLYKETGDQYELMNNIFKIVGSDDEIAVAVDMMKGSQRTIGDDVADSINYIVDSVDSMQKDDIIVELEGLKDVITSVSNIKEHISLVTSEEFFILKDSLEEEEEEESNEIVAQALPKASAGVAVDLSLLIQEDDEDGPIRISTPKKPKSDLFNEE